jgi:hypothetical protein
MLQTLLAKFSAAPALDIDPGQRRSRSRLLAHILAGRAVREHLLFSCATLFVVLFYGYHFGTFDQVIHLPFLKKFADASLYPGDPFMELRFQHYSYFWIVLVPFYKLGILEIAMFITHLLVTYSTFWALWTLSDFLFHNRLTNLISLVAFAFPHMTFGGWTIFEFSLLNRTFVLPFLLWAIILFLRRRYLLAFALLGLMYNLHALSVNFVLAMFLFDGVLERRKVGWRNLVLGLIFFMLAALPVLLWKLSGPGGDFGQQPEWFSIVARGMLYNNFHLFAPYPHILLVTAGGVGALALFFIVRRFAPPPEHDRTITNFMYALLLILLVQVITTSWLPLTIILELQIIRAGVFVLILSYLYFANYLAASFQSRVGDKFDWILLAGAFMFSVLPFVPVAVHALQYLIAPPRRRRLLTLSLLLGLSAFIILFIIPLNIWYPGIYVYGHETPWYRVQTWSRDHTPKDAVFITPPYIWWFYESDWRVFSERSTVVSLSELLDVAFAPNYTSTWEARFEAIAPGALARLNGDNFENSALIAQAFYGLSDEAVLRAACQYSASYLVVEKPHLRHFPVVYQNQQFVVYALQPQCDTQQRSSRWRMYEFS